MDHSQSVGMKMTKFEGGLEIKNLNSVEAIEAEIKVLQSKLEFYKELEKTKSPVEEAFKNWMGVYPPTNPSVDNIFDIRWRAFQKGYDAAYEEKVSEWKPTSQTPDQVEEGKSVCSQKWECLETGFITNPENLTKYQKARGIDTLKRKRIS